MEIPPGVRLTIDPGVEVRTDGSWSGAMFHLGGQLVAQGSSGDPVRFSGGGHALIDSSSSPAGSRASLSHTVISGVASLWPATGYTTYASFDLTDSEVSDVAGYSYVWYPKADVHVERNTFRDAAGFSVGTSDATVWFRQNVFVGRARQNPGCDGAWICNWAAYNGTTTQVHANNFARSSGPVLSLPTGYTSAAIDATSNYWGSMGLADVAGVVLDANDTFSRARVVVLDPLLSEPDPFAPPAPAPGAPSVAGVPTGTTSSMAATITLSGEIGATFSCSLDGASYTACSSPVGLTGLSDGTHSFSVIQSDRLGAASEPTTSTWTIDATAPQTTIVSGPSGPVRDGSPRFGFISSEDGSSFECRLDTRDWSSCSSPKSYSALTDGSHTFAVRATDSLGNTDATAPTRTFTVDTVAPQTTIGSGPSGPTGDASPMFDFSSSEDGSSFECRLDTGDWSSCSSPTSYSALSDGSHTFAVRASDRVGNTDATEATRTFTVDTVAPQTTIGSGPSGPTRDASPTFAFSSSEDGSSFECQLENLGGAAASWTACPSRHVLTGLSDGEYILEVRATDSASNTDPNVASRRFTVDTVAPETTIVSGPSGLTRDPSPRFEFGSSEAGGSFECRLDAGDWSACSWSTRYIGLSDGPHTFAVRASDPAGNTDEIEATQSFTVDTLPPQTTIVSGPSGPTRDRSPVFELTSSEEGSSFRCRLDGPGAVDGSWTTCSSRPTFSGLADGPYTLMAVATDPVGWSDATEATRTFTIDTVAPQTTIVSGPSGPTHDASPTFEFSSSEEGSSFECRLDTADWSPCSPSKSYSGLSDGSHSFAVRASDEAGNTDATEKMRTFTVDTVAPQTTIVSGPSGPTRDSSLTFTFSSSEDGSSFECRLDGPGDTAGDWRTCPSPPVFNLAEGAYTLRVRASDAASNGDPTGATRTFTIDRTAPEPPAILSPAQDGWARSASVALEGTAEPGSTIEIFDGASSIGDALADDGGRWTKNVTGLADGTHSFGARATDQAGNTSRSSASRMVGVDTTEPQTHLFSGPGATVHGSTVTFQFDSGSADSFECRLDGPGSAVGAWTTCISPNRYDSLGSGSYRFHVRATDSVGNTETSGPSYEFTIAPPAPDSPHPGTAPAAQPPTTTPTRPAAPKVPEPTSDDSGRIGQRAVTQAQATWTSILQDDKTSERLATRGAVLPFAAPSPGVLVVELLAPGAAGTRAAASEVIKIAATRKTLVQAGNASIRLRLNVAGRRLLGRARRLRVTLRVTFTPEGSPPQRLSRRVTLRKRETAGSSGR
ncbi:MAG TPA: Ig-like domain-containing protein [Solirubrobacteraceae bacterium]